MDTRRNHDEAHETSTGDDRVERLLGELRPVDVPPFYRARLLARLRAEAGGRARTGWVRSPALAWVVAAAAVIALVIVATRGGAPLPTVVPVAPEVGTETTADAAGAVPEIEPVLPEDSSIVGAGDVEIVAAITPPIEGVIVRLLVDEEDVTDLAEVTADYVTYSPGERFAEGEHIITIEIRDRSGMKIKDATWLFYTLDGKSAPDERV